MLRRLSIENYALIDKLEMELDPHLNIITGETGAGKSILLGALGLLLGNKNDGAATRDAERSCVIEGIFDISTRGMQPFFDDNDIDFEDHTIVRRMITPAGKSRSFINDIPVPLTLLREFSGQLIDIHSQHQNFILSSEKFRLSALDTVSNSGKLLSEYGILFGEYVALRGELSAVRREVESSRKDEEWLSYQVEELAMANFSDGEDRELEAELAILENADQISESLGAINNALDGDEMGVLSQLKSAMSGIRHVEDSYPQAKSIAERLYSTIQELKDINATVVDDSQSIEADPVRLERIGSRLDTIYTICRKHRAENLDELIVIRDGYANRLSVITHSDERIGELEAKIAEVRGRAEAKAEKLSATRKRGTMVFEKAIVSTLSKLGMVGVIFQVSLKRLDELNETGHDGVDYLFTANRDMTPQAVDKIASGGEISRVMLAMKALLAEHMQLPTIIFDEIDTGVSGRIAEAMGDIILSLSSLMQVVDITHLPQVASKGDTHFVVSKSGGRTSISRLTERDRTIEIAKMLSGSEITEAAMTQAKILLS